jgi:hypothetical protein
VAHLKRFALLILFACEIGCGFIPERVSLDDPRVVQLLSALRTIDRASLGFTPIDPNAKLTLETRPRGGYDAMLHVDGKTRRTIAFRHRGDTYEWIGEQEIFEGPDEYDSADGKFHEAITITYETVGITGVPLNRVYVDYRGNDPRLTDSATRRELSLAGVKPTLTKWGYRD